MFEEFFRSIITRHQPFRTWLWPVFTAAFLMLWLLITHKFGSMLVRTDLHMKGINTLTSCILCIVSPYSLFFCCIAYEATSLASFKVACFFFFFYNGGKYQYFSHFVNSVFVRDFLHWMSMYCIHFIVIYVCISKPSRSELALFDCTVACIVYQSNTDRNEKNSLNNSPS